MKPEKGKPMLKHCQSKLALRRAVISTCIAATALAGCDSKDGSPDDLGAPPTQWVPSTYKTSTIYKNFCEQPRTGVHPYTDEPFPDIAGSTALENHYLRAWTHEAYLWYDELPDLDPNNYTDSIEYFGLLRTSELTANGTVKDRFHFTEDEIKGDQLTFTGQRGGYGISWKFNAERELFVSFVEPSSPASDAGVTRGMQLTHVNGIRLTELTNEQIADANRAIFSPELGSEASFEFIPPMLGDALSVSLEAANISISAVLKHSILETTTGDVGYLAFNTFNTFTAENQLKAAFDDFAANNIDDLVVDLRYNGGGYLYIAAQLGYLVAGDSNTAGETFTVLQYNDKRSSNNVVFPFVASTRNTQEPSQPLTSVNLNRVYVITTGSTCSASESFINGLRGVGVEVIQIGSTTCGKPHGFNAQANCGTRYFSIDFESVNAQGFGEYIDGFEPVETGADPLSNKVTGCDAGDDLAHRLGDTNEAMLSTALYYRDNGTCPEATTASQQKLQNRMIVDGELVAPESDKVMRLAPTWSF
ncbi:MAG TPA: S41 family peptidase [Marinagarivorans sp.]